MAVAPAFVVALRVAVTVPLTRCAVVPTGSIRSGAPLVPISAPAALRRLMCNPRFWVICTAAACPLDGCVGAVLYSPAIGVTGVVPSVKAPLSSSAPGPTLATTLTFSALPFEPSSGAVLVPSLILIGHAFAFVLAEPWFAVTVPETGNVSTFADPLLIRTDTGDATGAL